jgi:transposase
MSNLTTFAGIDISKDSFDVCIITEEGTTLSNQKIAYDPAGMKRAASLLIKTRCSWAVMEATGPYYIQLAMALRQNGVSVCVVNPLVVRRYAQMQLKRTKTDKADAAMIADYALNQCRKLQVWKPSEAYLLRLGQLSAIREGLVKYQTVLKNQQAAFQASGTVDPADALLVIEIIAAIKQKVAESEQKMQAIIATEHPELEDRLVSIPGFGKKTALVLIMISGGFSRFANYRQLIAYIGLSPRAYDSGTTVKGKARVCKMGMSRIRAMLYVCAWSASRYNAGCKALYDRLVANNKPKRVALIAVVNKLLKQAFAIATKHSYYKADFTSYKP